VVIRAHVESARYQKAPTCTAPTLCDTRGTTERTLLAKRVNGRLEAVDPAPALRRLVD
jgi:hypothetical protein